MATICMTGPGDWQTFAQTRTLISINSSNMGVRHQLMVYFMGIGNQARMHTVSILYPGTTLRAAGACMCSRSWA